MHQAKYKTENEASQQFEEHCALVVLGEYSQRLMWLFIESALFSSTNAGI